MRHLRRRVSALFPPVVETDRRTRPVTREAINLRATEKMHADSNAVGDWTIYRIISQREIGNFLKSQLYRGAIERFSDRLPASEIRALVDATIHKERYDRDQIERVRRAEAARKAASSGAAAKVLSYRLRAAGLTA